MLKDSSYFSRGGANRLPPIFYNKKSLKALYGGAFGGSGYWLWCQTNAKILNKISKNVPRKAVTVLFTFSETITVYVIINIVIDIIVLVMSFLLVRKLVYFQFLF